MGRMCKYGNCNLAIDLKGINSPISHIVRGKNISIVIMQGDL